MLWSQESRLKSCTHVAGYHTKQRYISTIWPQVYPKKRRFTASKIIIFKNRDQSEDLQFLCLKCLLLDRNNRGFRFLNATVNDKKCSDIMSMFNLCLHSETLWMPSVLCWQYWLSKHYLALLLQLNYCCMIEFRKYKDILSEYDFGSIAPHLFGIHMNVINNDQCV